MTTLYLVQTGQTVWEEQARFDPAAGAPLTDAGRQAVCDRAAQLPAGQFSAVYASGGEAERQTAALLAGALGAKVRRVQDLREVDYGLWQGLTRQEVKRRNPKIYRRWTEAPGAVRPPDGETLQEAQERVRKALRAVLKRHRGGAAAVVLRPIVLGLARCLLEGGDIERVWQTVEPDFTWRCYEVNGEIT
jgi:broad specificity phosphatase PhoE